MIVISELEELFPFTTGTPADWAVPSYLLTVDTAAGLTELYVWFRLDMTYDRIFPVADVYVLHKNNVLHTLGGGFKVLGRDYEGIWRERTSYFKYSTNIEELMHQIIKGDALPISKLILMTHPIEDLRKVFKLSLETAIKGV